ncbi:MAG: ABC transporter ATP-binding protein [Kiritimatiellae bacterium]|nr:ABC transporter ATP-binding protein [Kiritimatiellia bacterium]
MWGHLARFGRQYIAPRKRKFGVVQGVHVLAAGLMLLPPLMIRHIIDRLIPAHETTALGLTAFGMVGLYLIWTVLSAWKVYAGHEVAQRVTSLLRNDLYAHVQKLSMSFHDNKKTGELLARIVDDINVIQEFVHHGPETFLLGVVMLLGSAAIMFSMNWALAMVGVLTIPLLVVFTRAIGGRMLREFRTVRERTASLADVLEENLAGIKVIKAFAKEDAESSAVRRANESHYHSRMAVIRWMSLLFPGTFLINSLAVVVVLFHGGLLVMKGLMTIGTLTAFVFYLRRFLEPILQMVRMTEQGGQFVAGIERFFQYMDIEADIRARPGAVDLKAVRGEVALEAVQFRYDRLPVLSGVSLTASPGQTVALVGPSGAGKTTITRLIPRFYDPFEGRVLVDGRDVRDIQLRALRSHIGMVMQDDFLFSSTVAENIAYGRPGASRAAIEEAARQANAEVFIRALPAGYETEIGKRGVKLSEGQRQRISIARALLKDPPILVLDEATSSVDSETEQLIQQAFEELRKGRTTFVIAHRLSTITSADQILFVQDGRIIERGTHKELLERDGQYARFYRIQFAGMARPMDAVA